MKLVIILHDPTQASSDLKITQEVGLSPESAESRLARLAYECGARFGPAYKSGIDLKAAYIVSQ